ncbi:interleukin 12Ba isoform X2 [Eleginops maclovinus]|uniref:interleukin 12Ba isoform X2 n=1 Tax=Eleginops maclovinus TaxID=56733 RepID=UPI003080A2F4
MNPRIPPNVSWQQLCRKTRRKGKGFASSETSACTHIKVAINGRIGETNAKMKLFIFSIVCVFLQVSHQNPTGNWTLLPHILVVEVDGSWGQMPLRCLEQPEELLKRDTKIEDVFWRKNGDEEEQTGNTYMLEVEESLGGGNYTCHSKDGSLLNHTVVLIQENENNEDNLKCSATNHSGEFFCSWTGLSVLDGKVAFIKARRVSDNYETQCSVDKSGRRWKCSSGQSNLICSVNDTKEEILCLDEQHCPFTEESQHIYITVYVWTELFLLEIYSKLFFLSEIVKPDMVKISKVNNTTIQWSYPSSWNSPYSYFPLSFEIAQLKRGCKRCEDLCPDLKSIETLMFKSTDVCQFTVSQRKTRVVCVRAKDALCNSPWSEWSHIRMNRGRKKKNNKV